MSMHISLPESLESWVEEQSALQGYASTAEYVQQILRNERQQQERRLREGIEQQLLAALDSGDPVEASPEFWEARRQKLRSHLERQGKADNA
jgi:antitoxin ParD1/3/4